MSGNLEGVPVNGQRYYLPFEEELAPIESRIAELEAAEQTPAVAAELRRLRQKAYRIRRKIYGRLSVWERVLLSRHPNRPQSLYYLNTICKVFVEFHGSRTGWDDPSIICGMGLVEGRTVVFVAQQKGTTTKERQMRNFGMTSPDGYRKALRMMKLAEKFGKPVVTLIDTPGAYPGIEAEEKGQAEAIARNLFEMARLRVPIVCVVIGEGASGGALGIGVGNRILMMENTWYSVISPESCSSILWRDWDHKVEAAEALKLTPQYLYKFGIIDEIIKEPVGGAHVNPALAAASLKRAILRHLNELSRLTPEELVRQRQEKFRRIGVYELVNAGEAGS